MTFFPAISLVGFNHMPKCQLWVERTFPHWALNFVASGHIYLLIDNMIYREITAPAAFLFRPGDQYSYGVNPPESWDHYFVSFKGAIGRHMEHTGLIPSTEPNLPVLKITKPSSFRQSFEDLFTVLQQNPLDNDLAAWQLQGLFLALHRQPPAVVAESHKRKQLNLLVDSMRKHPYKPRDFSQEASKLHWTQDHFRRVFKKLTGLPPVDYLNHCRIDYATRLLRESDLPIKEVATRCGIEDLFYFSKLFKKMRELPPGKYRSQHQLKI